MDLTSLLTQLDATQEQAAVTIVKNQESFKNSVNNFQTAYNDRKSIFSTLYDKSASKTGLTDVGYKMAVILTAVLINTDLQKAIKDILADPTVRVTVYDTSTNVRFKQAYDVLANATVPFIDQDEVDVVTKAGEEKITEIENKILNYDNTMNSIITDITLLKNKIDTSINPVYPEEYKKIVIDTLIQLDNGFREKG